MPLRPPRLDDRGFDDLVEELVARIPAHTPEWTHARVGDPGRTLIELFAWLTDTLLYRANLVPERQRLVFLKLLGIPLRPAIAARGLVTLRLTADRPITIRAGARISGPPVFETAGEITALPVEGRPYLKRALDEATRAETEALVRELMELYRALRPDIEEGELPRPYVTTPAFLGGTPSPVGVDLIRETTDHALWLALVAPEGADAAALRSTLESGEDGRPFTVSLGFAPALAPIERYEALPEPRPLRSVWEVLTSERSRGQPVYRSLDVIADSTRGLRREGVMRLSLAASGFGVPDNDLRTAPDAGVGDLPPRIDDEAEAARLVAWLRLRPTEPLESLPVSWVGLNAVEVEQTRTFTSSVVGVSDGRADQTFALGATSIDPAQLELEVEAGDRGFEAWQVVDTLAAHGRDARVFSVDAEAGTATFGDGLRGGVPAAGSRIRVRRMRSSGGRAGNLPPGSLSSLEGEDPSGARVAAPIEVLQSLPTRGGVDAETLAEAERRIPLVLRHGNRAVTRSDIQALAATTPGLRVGRVEVLERFKPHQRREDVPGVVSVMMLPAARRPTLEPPAPRPDRPFVEAAHAWLEARRTLGTELYVIGPEYIPVGASVGVLLREGFAREETLVAVKLALRAFLYPLAPGGPAGLGWPLGTAVTSPQAEVAVARVPGVAALLGLNLFVRAGDDWAPAPDLPGRGPGIALRRWQLPELLSVVVVEGTSAPADLRGAPNPFGADGRGGLSIPIVPEVC